MYFPFPVYIEGAELKIFIVGDLKPYNLEYFYRKALVELGNEVYFYDQLNGLKLEPLLRMSMSRVSSMRPLLNKLQVNKDLACVVNNISPDIVIIFKGHLLTTNTLTEINRSHKSVLIYPDSDRFPILLRERVGLFNSVFTQDNEKETFIKLGAKRVFTLPFACDPDFHKSLHLPKRYNLSFVGTFYLERYKVLKKIGGVDIFGKYWILRAGKHHRPIFGQEYIHVINESIVNLNIHNCSDIRNDGQNMRTFEVAGCGGLLFCEEMPSLHKYFSHNEVETYQDVVDLKSKLISLQENPDEIVYRGFQAQERCYREHTYKHRARQLLDQA